jgi:4-amino-4-deoxy-L-arabinose transferase-like glycosyltransferase
MENGSHMFKGTWFYIAVAGIFMLIICSTWLSDGMFMDGTIYAILSRNFANGSATFWQPHLPSLQPVFLEHPPLAFGLEGILFKIFGDSRFVERIYSLITILAEGLIIVSIWKNLTKKISGGWIPLLFWISMPTVTWAAVNNMLENTLVIFISLSVLFYLKSQRSDKIAFLFLSGFMLSLGFLTKGFVTFTPLAFPFFVWVFSRKGKFFSMVLDTFIMFISAILPLILIFLFTGAKEFFPKYLAIASEKIFTGETINSRFYILEKLLLELLPAFGIVAALLLYCMKIKMPLKSIIPGLLPASLFFSIGMAGVLPIMISMDQSTYFLLLSFPFFAISFSLIVYPLIETLLEKIDYSSYGYRVLKLSGAIALSAGIILSLYFSGDIHRDKNKLKDMRVILTQLKEGTTINILPEMYEDWSLHTYYVRYKNISLDADLNNRHNYLLIKNTFYSDTLNKEFERVDLKTKEYDLYRRKSADTTKIHY